MSANVQDRAREHHTHTHTEGGAAKLNVFLKRGFVLLLAPGVKGQGRRWEESFAVRSSSQFVGLMCRTRPVRMER